MSMGFKGSCECAQKVHLEVYYFPKLVRAECVRQRADNVAFMLLFLLLLSGLSAHVNGGPSGGSSERRPGSEDPHWRERKLIFWFERVACASGAN